MGEERPSTVSQQTQEVGQESRRSRGDTDPLGMGAETWGKVCMLGAGGGGVRRIAGTPFSSTWVTTLHTPGPHQPGLAVWICRNAGSRSVGEREGGVD